MRTLSLVALAAVISLSVPEARGEASAESTIRSGIYADAACSDPDFLWVYVPDITIDIDRNPTDGSVSIRGLAPESEPLAHGWQRFRPDHSEDESFGYFLRMTDDGGVQLLWWDPGPAKVAEPPRHLWSGVLPAEDPDAGDYWRLDTYARCGSIPFPLSLLHGEPASFLFSLEPAIQSCRSGHRSCIDHVFSAVDIHPDGALSTAEWSRIIRVTLYFSLAYGEEISSERLAATYAISVLAVPLAASAIVSSYDYDRDGGTSLAELLHALSEQGTGVLPDIAGLDSESRSKIEDAITILRGLSNQVPGLK